MLADEDRPVAAMEGGRFGLDLARATKPTTADFEHGPKKGASEGIAEGD